MFLFFFPSKPSWLGKVKYETMPHNFLGIAWVLKISVKPEQAYFKGFSSVQHSSSLLKNLQLWSLIHKQQGLSSNLLAFSVQNACIFSCGSSASQSWGISKHQRCPKHMANHKLSTWGLALSVSGDDTFQIETQLVIAWA